MSDIIRPIEPFQLTQGFGGNYEAYKKYGLKGHSGWDFKTKLDDTPKGFRYILASWLSKHYKTEDQGSKGFGKYFEVIVQLKNTWKLTYAHCKSIEAFTTKTEGEHMAISDSTGNSTGNHLHLTVKKGKLITGVFQHDNPNNGYFGAINPQLFFDELRAFKKEATLDKHETTTSELPQTPPCEESIAPEVAPEDAISEIPAGGETPVEDIQDNIPVGGSVNNRGASDDVLVEPRNDTNLGSRSSITRLDIFISQTLKKIWNGIVSFFRK